MAADKGYDARNFFDAIVDKVEGIIGWLKHPGRIKRVRLRGLKRVNHPTYCADAAHKLLRIVNLTRREARPTIR